MATLKEKDECGDLRWGIRENPPSDYLFEVESFSLFSESGYGVTETLSLVNLLLVGTNGRLYSLHEDEDYDEYMCLYLSLEDQGKEVHAIFRFFLFDQIRGNYLTLEGDVKRYDSVKYQWGVIFISLQEFKDPINGYLVNDTCVLGAEVYVVRRPVLQQRLSISNMVNVIYNYTWKLTHFSELVDDECFSDAFDIGSYKWRLYLKPNGDADNRGCNLSLYVEMMDPPDNSSDEHVKAEFKITLKDQINMKHYIKRGTNWFGPSTLHSWGWGSFIPLKNLHDRAKGFIVEDCCKFEAQITLLCKTHLKPLDS